MFKKVLIAEDHEIVNLSVQRTADELKIPVVDYVHYCDDAVEKIKKSLRENSPYDLLITDLYYDTDHREQRIKDGREMVNEIRKIHPSLKVIFFSAENKSGIIDSLFNDYKINGYVRKGRNDGKELKKAIASVFDGENYLALEARQDVKKLNSYEFSSFDVTLVSLLSQGILQKNIPTYLANNNIKPNSLSSIEKRLNVLKEELGINNNEQLIAFCKDLGII
ncbi:response regulator [Chryseobacterium sp. CFS15]|uniref:response regulator n=1 Tax=Chryseobacterium sp. CFS15 TaxID=2986946 RepID=UPI0028072006|nr:response regulator [Chryseobacterium sp. CFS15]MDQ8140527.1 response regulator [Chryseobacterium sp. CFS15]